MVRARTQNSWNSMQGGQDCSRGYERRVPHELNIGPEAGSLMAHSTGVSGLIPRSRFEAPDVHPINSRLCQKTITLACLRSGGELMTRAPDHLVRSHTDQFNISTRTVTCDACRIRKPDVTRCFCVSPTITVAQIWHTSLMSQGDGGLNGRRNTRVKPRRLSFWLQTPAEPNGKLAQRWFPVTWPIPR